MIVDNTQRNISTYLTWAIPIIILAKIIRWTILAHQLVGMSIGWGMVMVINEHLSPSIEMGANIIDNTCAFFDAINIFGIKTFEGWEIFFTFLYNIILYYIVRAYYRRNPEAGRLENIFIFLNVGIINIFCFTMSKECYQFLFWLLIVAAITVPEKLSRKRLAFIVAIYITYSFARKYYALVLVYFIVISAYTEIFLKNMDTSTASGRRKVVMGVLLLFIVIGGFHYLFMDYLSETDEETFNEMVRVNSREGTSADSEITPIFTGSQFNFTLDFFVKIFRLMFPVELLANPKPVYLMLITFQGFVAYFIYRNFMRGDVAELEEDDEEDESDDIEVEENEEEKESYTEEEDDEYEEISEEELLEEEQEKVDTRRMALYVYLAFLICSAGFEPDFGSWLRHESVAFPIIIFLM